MTRRTIGIDCGLNGAIALVVDGELVRVEDMPTVTLTRNGKNKRQVSVPELVDIIQEFDPTEAYVEKVFAMSGQGVTSVFNYSLKATTLKETHGNKTTEPQSIRYR
jgi:crossover junction endodeoxyribonuclease RuvC